MILQQTEKLEFSLITRLKHRFNRKVTTLNNFLNFFYFSTFSGVIRSKKKSNFTTALPNLWLLETEVSKLPNIPLIKFH